MFYGLLYKAVSKVFGWLCLLRLRLVLCLGAVAACLVGCSPASPLVVASDIFKGSFFPNNEVNQARLNPRFKYIRVRFEGRASLLVLAYIDSVGRGSQPTEIYVSASSEVLTLQGGEVLSFTAEDKKFQRESTQFIDTGRFEVWPPTLSSTPPLAASQSTRSPDLPAGVEKMPFNPYRLPLRWQPVPGGWLAKSSASSEVSSLGAPWFFTYQCPAKDFCLEIQSWSVDLQERLRAR